MFILLYVVQLKCTIRTLLIFNDIHIFWIFSQGFDATRVYSNLHAYLSLKKSQVFSLAVKLYMTCDTTTIYVFSHEMEVFIKILILHQLIRSGVNYVRGKEYKNVEINHLHVWQVPRNQYHKDIQYGRKKSYKISLEHFEAWYHAYKYVS